MQNIIILKTLFSFLISFLVTFYVVPLFCLIATKFNIVDNPDGKLKRHAKPTPYLGGLALYAGFIISLALTFPFENQIFLFLIGSSCLLLVGLVDDLISIKPLQKIAGQIIATLCFIKAGLHLKESFFYNYWNIPISFLWFLTVINSFNLIDVMDGLATTVAISTTMSFLFFAYIFNNSLAAILLASFLGSLIAFLYYNKPQAKIYLGDAGSLFIGGLLASVPFLFGWSSFNYYGYITPVIILSIPLIELFTLIIIRFYKGIPFYMGSPDHFSIYLQNNGWSKNSILIYCGFVSLILLTISSLFIYSCISLTPLVLLGTFFIVFWYFVLFAKKQHQTIAKN